MQFAGNFDKGTKNRILNCGDDSSHHLDLGILKGIFIIELSSHIGVTRRWGGL